MALQKPLVDGNGVAYVMLADGRHNLVYVGQQIRSFNANELAAPIPEPEVYALMLVGLGFVGVAVRRHNRDRVDARARCRARDAPSMSRRCRFLGKELT